MSTLQQIEASLIGVNDAVFQELCDSYLYHTEPGFPRINRSGSTKGKQKVKKGTPDAWYRLDNGFYVLVEYTTQQKGTNAKAFLNKLKKDIDGCLNFAKTTLKKSRISKLIYCCNSSLSLPEFRELTDYAWDKKARLDIRTLDTIAMDLRGKCAHIARDLLEISIDSAQILPPDVFVAEYDRSGWATTLHTQVVGRGPDQQKILEAVSNNRITIVAGPAGVGKSRLALHAMQQYKTTHPETTLYCISNKMAPIWDDVRRYLTRTGDFLILIDDANRQLPNLQILLLLFKEQQHGDLRIIITVRDYALWQVFAEAATVDPIVIKLPKSTDEDIRLLLQSADFNIQNDLFIDSILRIADGNARLAVMAARVAVETQNLFALHDVWDLYDKYFKQAIPTDLWSKQELLKTLGILSFFNAIDLLDNDWYDKAEKSWQITRQELNEALHQLEIAELAEMSEDRRAVKISDQVVGTYFFYRTFFQAPLLDFSAILLNFFPSHASRIVDTCIHANNTFGYEKVMAKVEPFIGGYFRTIEKNRETGLKFLEIFWMYMLDETLAFVHVAISEGQRDEDAVYTYNEKLAQEYRYNEDKHLSLLSNFYYHAIPQLADAVQLSVGYTRQRIGLFTQHCRQLQSAFVFTGEDAMQGYYRQKLLWETMFHSDKADQLWQATIYQVMASLMKTVFQSTSATRKKDAIIIHRYQLQLNTTIKELRAATWQYIADTCREQPDSLERFFKSYWQFYPDKSKRVYNFDRPYWLKMFRQKLDMRNFRHCHIVCESIYWARRIGLSDRSFAALSRRFEKDPVYTVFRHLQYDYFRGRQASDEKMSHDQYKRWKETDLDEHFRFATKKQWMIFLDKVALINDWLRTEKRDVNYCLDKVFAIHANRNPGQILQVLASLISTNNHVRYQPWELFKTMSADARLYNQLLDLLSPGKFDDKHLWLLNAYWFIPPDLITEKHARQLVNCFGRMNEYFVRLHGYEPFLSIVPDIFHRILETIYEQNKAKSKRLKLDWLFIEKYLYLFRSDLAIVKKTYLQQEKINDHFDHDFKDWLEIIRIDSRFLMEFLHHWTGQTFSLREYNGLSIIWELDNAEELLMEALNYLSTGKIYAYREDFANAFFDSLKEQKRERAIQFLRDYRDRDIHNGKKMNMIFDCVRHSFPGELPTFLKELLQQTNEVSFFKAIAWTDKTFSSNGETVWGEVRAEQYKNILDIIGEMKPGYKFVQHKNYLKEKYDAARKSAVQERMRRFFRD